MFSIQIVLCLFKGTSELLQVENACEVHKTQLKSLIASSSRETRLEEIFHSHTNDQFIPTEADVISDTDLDEAHGEDDSISTWIIDLKSKCAEIVNNGNDDGDRDNLMYNDEFVKKMSILCKKMPMWSAINMKTFKSDDITASSAISESYFKNIKQSFKDIIPCSLDTFVGEHITSMQGSIKLSSNKIMQTDNDEQDLQKEPEANMTSNENTLQCMACKNGDFPSGAHTCTFCKRSVHLLDGCSVPITQSDEADESEGYGQQRICINCNQNRARHTGNNNDVAEMHYEENWRGQNTSQKQNVKRSKFLSAATEWTITNNDEAPAKRTVIGLLQNGASNQIKAANVGDNTYISLKSTSAFDSVCQLLCISYVDSESYRILIDDFAEDEIFEVVKTLAKK